MTFDQFAAGLLDAGLARIPPESAVPSLPYRGTLDDHLDLLRRSKDVLATIARDNRIQCVSAPALFHPDLHKRNIFVDPTDPTRITALIDWQGACLDPVFFSAGDPPDLCDFPESIEDLVYPENDVAGNSPERERLLKDVELCRKTWAVCLLAWSPNLHQAHLLDKDLVHPFRYCYSSWRDSAAIFRDGLVRLSQRWVELRLPDACPYHPSKDELAEHARQLKDLESAISLKHFVMRAIGSNEDGWVSVEACEAAKAALAAALTQWLSAVDEDMDESKAKLLWPFDI